MMLLPSELRTLVFLAGLAAVRVSAADADDTLTPPTNTNVPNAPTIIFTTTVAPLPSSLEDSNDFAPAPSDVVSDTTPEPEPTDDVNPCDLEDPPEWCEEPPPFWHPEVTATGWGGWDQWMSDGIGGDGGQGFAPSTTELEPPIQTPIVITTRTPTIIDIRTSVDASTSGALVDAGTTPVPERSPANSGHTKQQSTIAQPTAGADAPPEESRSSQGDLPQPPPQSSPPGQPIPEQLTPEAKYSTASQQTAATGSSLLDAIINQLGKPQPGTQLNSPIPATAGLTSEAGKYGPQVALPASTARMEPDNPVDPEVASSHPKMSPSPEAASPHNIIAVGNTITVGSATLTLTTGLSTVIGTGSDTTLVAIQTDSASRTVITISSSGTAVMATMTHSPATITLPRTGFEPSVTGDDGRGVSPSSPGVGAATTISRGTANGRRVKVDGVSTLILGLLGFVGLPSAAGDI